VPTAVRQRPAQLEAHGPEYQQHRQQAHHGERGRQDGAAPDNHEAGGHRTGRQRTNHGHGHSLLDSAPSAIAELIEALSVS
jgi:hypothetical protein